MFNFGIILAPRAYRLGGWRVYFRNGSCWHYTEPDAWRCLWGGPLEAPAWELQARREKGPAVAAA